ncbi:vWA domain-containing protein [Variovorax sp. J22R133]|uniref:vWA domain-containing protein n=1 Tax=Variovorax brevis TaxID=3053503 RepID=UPI0025756CD4|nr:vWA domain-containing protein [Variovorax sp. J22R133]MDM0111841.1 vWA domain-containing protein [Variovorax sp. J22R133]
MSFDAPWLLWLLPLALLPLWGQSGRTLINSWTAMLSRDRASQAIGWTLRVLGVVTLAALILGMAGAHLPEYDVERVGKGAEIVLLLDRSRSMDQGFAGSNAGAPKGTGPEAIDYYMKQRARLTESKGLVARRMLSEFTANRPDDRFGMIVFSTLPIRVLEFTQKNETIQAAIAAGDIGRGLSETNIGLAIEAALGYFADRAYTGSRIIMLVSDGGDRLDAETRERIAHQARKFRVGIYWIYLRSVNSPGLTLEKGEAAANVDSVPEYALHHFFQSTGSAYHAYEASNPEALKEAIDAVNRLENLPITYLDTMPRRDLAMPFFALALGCVSMLLAASLVEIRRWA